MIQKTPQVEIRRAVVVVVVGDSVTVVIETILTMVAIMAGDTEGVEAVASVTTEDPEVEVVATAVHLVTTIEAEDTEETALLRAVAIGVVAATIVVPPCTTGADTVALLVMIDTIDRCMMTDVVADTVVDMETVECPLQDTAVVDITPRVIVLDPDPLTAEAALAVDTTLLLAADTMTAVMADPLRATEEVTILGDPRLREMVAAAGTGVVAAEAPLLNTTTIAAIIAMAGMEVPLGTK